jgi:hypothetical protein
MIERIVRTPGVPLPADRFKSEFEGFQPLVEILTERGGRGGYARCYGYATVVDARTNSSASRGRGVERGRKGGTFVPKILALFSLFFSSPISKGNILVEQNGI